MVPALRPPCGGFGRRGEVLSAEVVTGSTRLLLSVTSMEPVQMDLFLRERRAHIGALGVDVEILQTITKHRAIDLTKSEGFQIHDMPPIEAGQGPTFRSANDDLFIYLVEEAAFSLSEAVPPEADMKEVEVKLKHETALKLGSRGVHPTDVRGDMSLRRKKELEMALGRVQVADKRTWIALRGTYTFAEQAATDQFTKTVVFEPWGGNFGATGWTNSQPLDILDGYVMGSSGSARSLSDLDGF